MISQTLILSFQKLDETNKVKNGGNAKMVVVFSITEMNCLKASLFHDFSAFPFMCVQYPKHYQDL